MTAVIRSEFMMDQLKHVFEKTLLEFRSCWPKGVSHNPPSGPEILAVLLIVVSRDPFGLTDPAGLQIR